MGIHFVISQIVGYVAILYLSRLFSDETEAYYQSVIVLTGMTGIMAMLISLFFTGETRREEGWEESFRETELRGWMWGEESGCSLWARHFLSLPIF